jgi:hypothetical protein
MSTDKHQFNRFRNIDSFNSEAEPTFNEVTEQDTRESQERIDALITKTRETLGE